MIATTRAGGVARLAWLHLDGSPLQLLTADTMSSREPAISRDGKRVAFVCGDDLCVMDVDGGHLARLTRTPEPESSPTWSPDGSEIAFARMDGPPEGPRWHLFKMRADGIGAALRSEVEGAFPDWSPDGQHIVFQCQAICIMSADGTGVVQLPVTGTEPTWSPDGRRLAFVIGASSYTPLVGITDVDGAGLRTISLSGAGIFWVAGAGLWHPVTATSPTWSPDGRHIAVSTLRSPLSSVRSIMSVQVDGSDVRVVAPYGSPEGSDFSPAWRPRP